MARSRLAGQRPSIDVRIVVVGLGPKRLAGYGVAAAEPTAEIDIGTSSRAERPIVIVGRLATNRAARLFRRRFARRSHPTRRSRHAVSISARFGQKKVTGKPSLCNIPMTSVSGRPTTLV